MSAVAVQRVVVRMHFDAAFATRVVDGSEPLPELTEAERALLVGLDARAFRADTLRPQRAVYALVEELPTSTAVIGLPALFDFLRSSSFHACVQQRGVMVLACAEWLAAHTRAGDLARIEGALARARRRRVVAAPGTLVRASGIEVVRAGEGTLAHMASLLATLRAAAGGLTATITSLRLPLPAAPPAAHDEHVLIERGALSTMTEGLAAILAAADRPVSPAALCDVARAQGADPGEDREVIDSLVVDGLLVSGADSAR